MVSSSPPQISRSRPPANNSTNSTHFFSADLLSYALDATKADDRERHETVYRRRLQQVPHACRLADWRQRVRFLREAIYRWVARNRYRWFGTKDVCGLPTEAERRRML